MNKSSVAAIVLAGGRSSRMGENKAFMPFKESCLLEEVVKVLSKLFEEIIIVTENVKELECFSKYSNLRIIPDMNFHGDKNSLIGMYTGLSKCKAPFAFITGCDMPFLNSSLINYMMGKVNVNTDLVIPYYGGHYQPLHGIYGKGCLKPMELLLENRTYKINKFFGHVNITKIDLEEIQKFDRELKSFLNINTQVDYNKALKEMKK